MNQNINFWLVKIDRFFAWVLLICIIIFLLSGYGMTKGIIDPAVAVLLHETILPPVLIVAFVGHTSLALRLVFMRWRMWNKVSLAALVLIYLLFFFGFGYLEFFYKQPQDLTANNPAASDPSQNNNMAEEKTFTLEELAKYNGQNGMPAYVAVDGVVYDVTTVFKSGRHYSHVAGQDLSKEFYSQHVKTAIAKYPVVGKMQK